jgi:hypothetical protein
MRGKLLYLITAVWMGLTPIWGLVVEPIKMVDLVDDSDAIVLGTVMRKDVHMDSSSKYIFTYYWVKSESNDKLGPEAKQPTEVVIRILGGTMNGVTQRIAGLNYPQIGERAYLFLEKDKLNKQHFQIKGLTQGHFTLVKSSGTGKWVAQGKMQDLREIDPKSRLKAKTTGVVDLKSTVPAAVDFEEFRAAVRQQVLRGMNPRYRIEKAKSKAAEKVRRQQLLEKIKSSAKK